MQSAKNAIRGASCSLEFVSLWIGPATDDEIANGGGNETEKGNNGKGDWNHVCLGLIDLAGMEVEAQRCQPGNLTILYDSLRDLDFEKRLFRMTLPRGRKPQRDSSCLIGVCEYG